MPLNIFSSKKRQNKLQKRRPGIYPSEHEYNGSQATIQPEARGSDEHFSLASTLALDQAPPSYRRTDPEYSSFDASSTATGRTNSTQAESLVPRRIIPRPRVPQPPLFPLAPSSFIVPDLASAAGGCLASLSPSLWKRIASFLTPSEAAKLALASKTLRYRLGSGPWQALNLPENKEHKINVLLTMDRQMPDQLLCFLCASYHLRLRPGREQLQEPNKLVVNPVYACPNATDLVAAKIRLTHGRVLPFSHVSLVMRAERYGPEYGIDWAALSRRWKCRDSGWTHATRVYCHEGHMLLRCTSTCFAEPNLTPSQERMLLYSRSDYAPYFSVCEHWQRGNLMRFCKCALSHVPEAPQNILAQLRKAPGVSLSRTHVNQLPKQCDDCKPMRRCPECPTEYLMEVKIVEDQKDPVRRFKHALCVTRWSDLGDGTSPKSLEWAACNGEAGFASLRAVKHATLSTIFETAVSNGAPLQVLLPLGRQGHVY